MKILNIAIAGCGPAGLAAALLLRRDGHNVALYERFEKPQPIGSGLMIQPTGMAVLQFLGLADSIRKHGNRIERLHGIASQSGRTVLNVEYDALRKAGVHGIGIHRAALFDILYKAVQDEEIFFNTGKTIIGSSHSTNGKRVLHFENGANSGEYDLIVDALGTRTPLAPETGHHLAYGALWASLDWCPNAGFDQHALQQRYYKSSIMAGVLPIGTLPNQKQQQIAFFWSLRADCLQSWRDQGLEKWKGDVLALWPETKAFLDQISTAEQLTFAHYAHRSLKHPIEAALIHIGDAWHSTSPQLGQGANMALLDAYALARALRANDALAKALNNAVQMRKWHVQIYQALSIVFTPAYQSDSNILPFIRDQLVGPFSKLWPFTKILAALVSGSVGRPLKALGLASPGPTALPFRPARAR